MLLYLIYKYKYNILKLLNIDILYYLIILLLLL